MSQIKMLLCCTIELLSLDKNNCCNSYQRICHTNETNGSFFLVSPVIDPVASSGMFRRHVLKSNLHKI